jgi:hypothetical protein
VDIVVTLCTRREESCAVYILVSQVPGSRLKQGFCLCFLCPEKHKPCGGDSYAAPALKVISPVAKCITVSALTDNACCCLKFNSHFACGAADSRPGV